jgi:quinoprotein glucose dehydrogenase
MRWVPFGFFAMACAAVLFASAQDVELPAGKGKDTLEKMCTPCHSLERVTNEKYSKRRWSNVVDDMVSRGAEGTDTEVSALVSYLVQNFGKPINVNTTSAKEIADTLQITPDQADTVVKYRADHGQYKSIDDLAKVPGIPATVLDEQKKNIQF